MTTTELSPYLTVKEAAEELGMTRDGVHKLILRGHLRAIKRSERRTLIPRLAFDAYIRRFEKEIKPDLTRPQPEADADTLRQRFEQETGHTVEQWLSAYKCDQLADTLDTARLTVQAMALSVATSDVRAASGEASAADSKPQFEAVAALMATHL